MEKIRSAVDGLIASRKGLLALIGLVTIQLFLLIVTIGFIVDWIVDTGFIHFEFVKDVFVAGFQWDSAIIAAYAAANISGHYIDKKKDENHGKKR